MLSICRAFLSNRRQRVLDDGRLLGTPLFILYISEMLQLVENRLYAYADDYTLTAVVRKPADLPAVAASLN